ncbi:MAG: TerC family protein [Candidatus Nanopelagicales bacterium]|nr:TerC family protein [Candidatus Nanopelagicales bacterium]
MNVPTWLWLATLAGFLAIICVDLFVVDSRPHTFSTKEAGVWVGVYMALAALFAVFLSVYFGLTYGGQFVAGYLTEYSLSVDNLFVFLVLMTSFAVPAVLQHRVLLVGVVIALILRGILIVLGAELISRFASIFYLFGAFLLFTAWKVWKSDDEEPDPAGNAFVKFVTKRYAVSPDYDGTKLRTVVAGKRMLTPLALVMLAIGTTDVLFALDSIPAVFGVTHEAFIVFTANAFALMGLRQLYFLLQGLMERLTYLNYGLAIILGFIGVKLILEAIHETTSLQVPLIPVWLSLVVIIGVLCVTTVLSLRTSDASHGIAESDAS